MLARPLQRVVSLQSFQSKCFELPGNWPVLLIHLLVSHTVRLLYASLLLLLREYIARQDKKDKSRAPITAVSQSLIAEVLLVIC